MKPLKVLQLVPTVLPANFRGSVLSRVKIIWPISDFKGEAFHEYGSH